MQDFAYVLQQSSKDVKVSYTQYPPEFGYFPVKNNLAVAADLSQKGIPPMGAASAESAVYHAYSTMLRMVGCTVEPPEMRAFAGVALRLGPRVVLSPSFAPGMKALRAKFTSPEHVKITARSTLVLDGEHIEVRVLKLDGALTIRVVPSASLVIEKLEMHNSGTAGSAEGSAVLRES